MPRWSPKRRAVLEALAAEITHLYPHGRIAIAVDGLEGVGRGDFARDLVEALRRDDRAAFSADLADFGRSRAEILERGGDGDPAWYREHLDIGLLRRALIEPFRLGGSTGFQLAAFDPERDAPRESAWTTAPADAYLVVHGDFANAPELRDLWSWSLWLEAPVETVYERLAERTGLRRDPDAEEHRRRRWAQEHYRREADPTVRAVALIDLADPEHPRRIFADSC
ncbi:uridine kinase [Schumannella luteola]|uniref:Uridine kinase n=1 Tax=Schumannella luteola TaxID=472059 RepID=A0A852YB00_9MICO|nr:uridine kinase [Schumannella luteola]NYG99713.1 uridine kinase [Schumannella luteola]TPX06495.1 uridine kinase [Schumannella luteola]